jgi:hypothetical protein
MFNTVTVEVDVDLSEIESDVFEYAERNGYVKEEDVVWREEIKDLIEDLEKEIYIYTTKSDITLEDVVARLKELL